MTSRAPAAQRGVTLVELMVGLAVAGILVAAGFSTGAMVLGTYRDHKRMVGTERSARVSLDIISDALRNSGPAVPSGMLFDLVACADVGTVTVTNSTTGPDQLGVIHASGGVVTSLRQTFSASSTTLVLNDGEALVPGDLLVISNLEQGMLVEIGTVTLTSGEYYAVLASAPSDCGTAVFPTGDYPAGSLVVRARRSHFAITEMGGEPTLTVDPDGPAGPLPPEPLALGIEDLQVAIGIDSDADGTLEEANSTSDEWIYNVAGDITPAPVTSGTWRGIRVSLSARSLVQEDEAFGQLRPALEDHDGATATDGYRRRGLSATVELRNARSN